MSSLGAVRTASRPRTCRRRSATVSGAVAVAMSGLFPWLVGPADRSVLDVKDVDDALGLEHPEMDRERRYDEDTVPAGARLAGSARVVLGGPVDLGHRPADGLGIVPLLPGGIVER